MTPPVPRIQLSAPFPDAARSSDPADIGLGAYAAQTARACPYLAPSIRARQSGWTRLSLPTARSGTDRSQVEATLFEQGLWAAEQVRERAAAGDRLACEVVAVDWPDTDARHEAVAEWPHWALKNLLAPVGVVCGRFAACADTSSDQPEAKDVLILALRVAVPAKDHLLLGRTPALARTVATAVDDGRSVLAAVPGLSAVMDPAAVWPAVRAWASTLPQPPRTEGSPCATT